MGEPVVVTEKVPAVPWVNVVLLDEVMVGATGAGFTVRENGVECVAEAPVPVTVIEDVPTGVVVDVVTVMVEL